MKKVTIEDFFSKKFEIDSTSILITRPDTFSPTLMENYVLQLMDYSLQEYLDFLSKHPIDEKITSKDITQMSSLEDSTANMCHMMLAHKNKGLTLIEIATYLHNEKNYKNNAVALIKYGENQVKTARQMGLTFLKEDLWYLSSVGFILYNLPQKTQQKFFAINLLRDPFYSKVILSLYKKDTNIKDFMTILSESTQKRRSSSCTKILSFFLEQCKIEDIRLHNLSFK